MPADNGKVQIAATISRLEREALDEMANREQLGIGNMIRLCIQEAALRRGIHLVPEEERLQALPEPERGPVTTERSFAYVAERLVSKLPQIRTIAELKIILYVYDRTHHLPPGQFACITYSEFCSGYERTSVLGTQRPDDGTGLSLNSVKSGIRQAVEHGLLIQESNPISNTDAVLHGDAYRLKYRLSDALIGEPIDAEDAEEQ